MKNDDCGPGAEPVLLSKSDRARLRSARIWLRRYVQWWGWRTASKRAECSTEALARFLAGFAVRQQTIARIELLAARERESQEAQRGIREVLRRHRETPDEAQASTAAPAAPERSA